MSKTPLLDTALVIEQIADERVRQTTAKDYSHEHDDEHTDGELAAAAGCYAMHNGGGFSIRDYGTDDVPSQWPFEAAAWKPKDPRRDLVRAAALIVAEIERIDRAAK